MRYGLRRYLSLLILVVGVQAGHAAVLQVDQADPDCNDGTGSPAFCSLVPAVTAAVDGDTILIGPGMYTGPENLGIEFYKSITITGSGSDQTVFDGGGDAFFMDVALPDDFTVGLDFHLLGLTITNAVGDPAALKVGFPHGSVDLRDIVAIDNDTRGVLVSTSTLPMQPAHISVSNSKFIANEGGLTVWGNSDMSRNVISDSLFLDNTDAGGAAIWGTVYRSRFENNFSNYVFQFRLPAPFR